MVKKIIIILCISAIVMALCFLPLRHTSTVTLNAVKLDSSGREVGQVDIPLEFTAKKSVFMLELESVSIGAFDGYTAVPDIAVIDRAKSHSSDYWSMTVAVGNLSGDLPTTDDPTLGSVESNAFRCILKVSADCDRWLIHITPADAAEEYYYVASIGGSHTVHEMLNYFKVTGQIQQIS